MFDPAVIAAQRPCKNPFVVDPASWKPTTNQYSSPLYINVPSALVPHSVLNCTHKVDVAPWGGGRVESCHCQAWAESRKLRVVCGLDNPHDPEVLAGIGFSPNDKGEGDLSQGRRYIKGSTQIPAPTFVLCVERRGSTTVMQLQFLMASPGSHSVSYEL